MICINDCIEGIVCHSWWLCLLSYDIYCCSWNGELRPAHSPNSQLHLIKRKPVCDKKKINLLPCILLLVLEINFLDEEKYEFLSKSHQKSFKLSWTYIMIVLKLHTQTYYKCDITSKNKNKQIEIGSILKTNGLIGLIFAQSIIHSM